MHLRVLLIDSEPEEILFLQEVFRDLEEDGWLREWSKVEAEYAATWAEAEKIIAITPPHAILLNPYLADRQGAEAFRLAQTAVPDVPVILLVDAGDEAFAVKLVREGAQDFLLKKQVDCEPLAHALRNAVLRQQLLAAARSSALIDSLTGLYSQAGFLLAAGRDRDLAGRLDRRWMILVAEPQNLAAISQAFGEQRRDLELVEAADHLRVIAGPAYLLGRITDRHFAMGVFDTEPESVEEAWARIRSLAAERRIQVGVSIFDPGCPKGLEAMLEQATADLPRPKPPARSALETPKHAIVAGGR